MTSTVDLNIPGYLPIIIKDRAGHGRGIALYVANSCAVKRLIHFQLPEIESLWAEIKTNTSVFAVCVCYRPPNNTTQFWEDLQESIDDVKQAGYETIIIAGDLNADPKRHNRTNCNIFVDLTI